MKLLLRIYAFLFHLPLVLFFFALGAFSLIEGVFNLNLPMFPWTGKQLTYSIFILAAFGLIALALALKKQLRLLFVLHAFGVLGFALYATFLAPANRFRGVDDFQWALAFCAGAFGALMGATLHAFARRR